MLLEGSVTPRQDLPELAIQFEPVADIDADHARATSVRSLKALLSRSATSCRSHSIR